ncbi:MAG: hypothetical protein ACI8PZ_006692 [Myxococcota bacterium]
MEAAAPVWDAEVLARVRHLHLRARNLTDALLTGEHRSRRVGQAIEFADYQEYVPGMDLRRLDWRVWARSDRLVVRRYETETELPCTLVVDLSGDLSTGDAARGGYPPLESSKAGYAIVLTATLAYFLHRHGEPVGLEIVAGEGMRYRSLPARGGRNHLQSIFLQLASVRPGGTADLKAALGAVGARVRRRSWVGVVTDGMEEPANWLPSLAAFARRGADVRLFHLFDPREWSLDVGAPALFFSPEGGEALAVDPAGAREAFNEVVQEYVDEVRGGVVRWGGRYMSAPTDAPLETVLGKAIAGGLAGGAR